MGSKMYTYWNMFGIVLLFLLLIPSFGCSQSSDETEESSPLIERSKHVLDEKKGGRLSISFSLRIEPLTLKLHGTIRTDLSKNVSVCSYTIPSLNYQYTLYQTRNGSAFRIRKGSESRSWQRASSSEHHVKTPQKFLDFLQQSKNIQTDDKHRDITFKINKNQFRYYLRWLFFDSAHFEKYEHLFKLKKGETTVRTRSSDNLISSVQVKIKMNAPSDQVFDVTKQITGKELDHVPENVPAELEANIDLKYGSGRSIDVPKEVQSLWSETPDRSPNQK